MNCACHDEPAYWQKEPRTRVGGWWRCAVRKRETSRRVDAARRDLKTQRQRDRYDNDPIYRIEHNLHTSARRRRNRINRQRAALVTEHGGT